MQWKERYNFSVAVAGFHAGFGLVGEEFLHFGNATKLLNT